MQFGRVMSVGELPLQRLEPRQTEMPPSSKQVTRILVADNMRLICQLVKQTCEDLEIEVQFATTGTEAARLLLCDRFDFAVIDAGLRGTTCSSLLTLAADENVPVLVVSGQTDAVSDPLDPDHPFTETQFCLAHLPARAAVVMLESLDIVRRVKAAEHVTRQCSPHSL